MRYARDRARGWVGLAALVLSVAVAGCDGTPTTQANHARVVSTATPSPTVTPAPMIPTPGCPPLGYLPTQPRYVAASALRVSSPERMGDYPSELLPSNVPNAPYQLATSAVTAFAPSPAVNPHLSPGYLVQFCNQTATTHTLSSLTVSIASFTPSSGPVNVWQVCDWGAYNAATKQGTNGCGGGFGGDVGVLGATLSSDSAGASAPAMAGGQYGGTNLPATLGPHTSIALLVAVNGLTSAGTYALSFGVSVDGATPTSVAPGDGSFLIAPSAVVWSGTACQTPAMQAQIPAATKDTYYVCPPAS
jgi:hypothetical protein